MSSSKKYLAIAFLFLAFSGASIMMFYVYLGTRAELVHATTLPAPMALPEFSLLDHTGEAFTRDDFRDRWNIVFFGFTHCPDICPATLQQLAIAKSRLAEAGEEFPQIILISVDPERDSPDVMAAYVGNFGADMKGVTGDLQELTKLTGAMGIFFARSGESGDGGGDYSVDHSAFVLLIDESADWHSLFSAPHNIDSFVNDLPILMAN